MSDINSVNLTGRLTRDPELRQTAGGTAVLGFGLAVGERRKNGQTGEWEDYTNFVDCTMFGQRAESLSRILRKGMPVSVHGRLHWSQWEADGQRRSKLDVTVDELVLPPRADGQQADQQGGYRPPQNAQEAHAQASAYGQQPSPAVYDEEIPF